MSEPRRLSAGAFIVWMGRIVPAGMFALVIGLFLSGPHDNWTFSRAIGALALVTVLGLVAWFQWTAVSSDVMDHGDHLVITVRGQSTKVPLSAIRDVEYKPVMLGNLVTLYLAVPGAQGAVSYVPAGGFRRSTRHDVDMLRQRVLQARFGDAS